MKTYEERKEYYKEYNKRKKKEKDAYNKEYYLNNREKLCEYSRNYPSKPGDVQKWRRENPEKVLFLSAKSRCRTSGLEFSIDLEDIVIPTHCPYLGCELTVIRGNGRQQTNVSLDRIDSTKGYVKGNVQVISWLANTMKQNATIEQLKAFAHGVLKHHD